MGVQDTECRTCGTDITHLPSSHAYCQGCYLEYCEKLAMDAENEESPYSALVEAIGDATTVDDLREALFMLLRYIDE